MFCSTIIPTVGRESLGRAVESVLSQTFTSADFEIIVVNDAARPLPTAAWQRSARVRIITTQQHERSIARNTGAAMARGRYLHFLDDDDWLAPDALRHFWERGADKDVAWLYGITQLVDRAGRSIIQLDHRLEGNCFLPVMAGEWIPLQASLIGANVFFHIGGFNPLLSGPEDIDLLRRVALWHELAAVPEVVAFIEMGEEGSTTNYEQHSLYSRWAREKILDEPTSFDRLRASKRDAFWSGRLVRLYLTSSVWNARRFRLLTATSRAIKTLSGCVAAGSHLFAPTFWRAVTQPYASKTFARGFDHLATASIAKGT